MHSAVDPARFNAKEGVRPRTFSPRRGFVGPDRREERDEAAPAIRSALAGHRGSPWAFLLATLSVLLWLVVGPIVGYSDAWLVLPATATSIGAFLIVFLIQFSQNRDMAVMQLKLDELIRGLADARSHLIGLEHRSDEELAKVAQEFTDLRKGEAGE